MPPKTVVCIICGRTVNKRQTLLVREGERACCIHVEAKKLSEELINKQTAEKEIKEKRDKKKKRSGSMTLESLERDKDFIQNHCWCCCKKGIHIRELYYKMLVGMEKVRLKAVQLDFLNMPFQLKKEMNLLNVPTLVTLKIHTDISKNLHKIVQDVFLFTRTATLCTECLKKLNLFDEWEKTRPKPVIDQMLALGAQYETSDLAKNVLKDAVDSLE